MGPMKDTFPPDVLPIRKQFYVGTGFNITENALWMGFGVRWFDGGGFFKSGEYTLAATLHPIDRLLTSLTVANLTANNDAGVRIDARGSYRLTNWL